LQWYNHYIKAKGINDVPGSGWGFSLVGENWLNFGWGGIIMGFALMGALITHLYNRRFHSFWGYYLYLCAIYVYMKSPRDDYYYFMSSLVKECLVAFVLVMLARFGLDVLSRMFGKKRTKILPAA
jgi:hypothetical protein